MDNVFVLLLAGFFVGTLGTLIGAGGGFILVPLLLLTHPDLPPDIVTAISMAIVAANAISGSIAYARSGRIDYHSGILFAVFTVPGSIAGVYLTAFIPQTVFHVLFGILLIGLASFLFLSKNSRPGDGGAYHKRATQVTLTDAGGTRYLYRYRRYMGILISLAVGFISPVLGIGGGIIHVPALVKWLHFPVYIATATSHFILAVMATVSVATHIAQGSYADPAVLRMVLLLGAGAVAGAQAGAFLSHRIQGPAIVRALAICLALVGLRILIIH